jgi:transposase InsO family protein
VNRAAPRADPAASHIWVSAAVGAVAIPGRACRESQGGVPDLATEPVVRASALVHPRPRVQGWTGRASRSDEPWAMDVRHVPCGQDGRGHLAAVIDCHDREVNGYEVAFRSRAKEAERAVEAARLQQLGTLRPIGAPVLRSDNGLILQSRRFRQACHDYRLQQEFITPHTPEQNGIVERSFRSLKEECVWQQTVPDI